MSEWVQAEVVTVGARIAITMQGEKNVAVELLTTDGASIARRLMSIDGLARRIFDDVYERLEERERVLRSAGRGA